MTDDELSPLESWLLYIVITLALSACAGLIAAGLYVGWLLNF